MLQFLDTSDTPLSPLSVTFYAGTDTPMSVRFDCRAGYGLTAVDVPANLTVNARFLGDTIWTDIGTGSLDVSAFDGIRKTVELEYIGGVITSEQLEIFKLRLARI